MSVMDITFNSQRHMHSRNKRLHATRSDAPHAPGAAMGPLLGLRAGGTRWIQAEGGDYEMQAR